MAYTRRDKQYLICELCPHACRIAPGKDGFCGVRGNRGGELDLPYYGALSAQGLDPIEKKPLYHFYPGSLSFSLGFVGCNLRCPFCQNYQISQSTDSQTNALSPAEAVERAIESGAGSISYTYSEPLIHIEFILDTAAIARRNGLKNVLVSNGMLNESPAKDLYRAMDAANIDLKSFSRDYYRSTLMGDLDTVLNSIAIAYRSLHLELTTLIIPDGNDGPEEFEAMIGFIAALSEEIPWHLSRYFPRYRSTKPPTPEQELIDLAEKASRRLSFVYLGNMRSDLTDTRCPACGRLLISRSGYRTLIKNRDRTGCDECGTSLPYRI